MATHNDCRKCRLCSLLPGMTKSIIFPISHSRNSYRESVHSAPIMSREASRSFFRTAGWRLAGNLSKRSLLAPRHKLEFYKAYIWGLPTSLIHMKMIKLNAKLSPANNIILLRVKERPLPGWPSSAASRRWCSIRSCAPCQLGQLEQHCESCTRLKGG